MIKSTRALDRRAGPHDEVECGRAVGHRRSGPRTEAHGPTRSRRERSPCFTRQQPVRLSHWRPPTASSQGSVQQMQLRILALAAALLCGASVTNGGSDDSTTCSR